MPRFPRSRVDYGLLSLLLSSVAIFLAIASIFTQINLRDPSQTLQQNLTHYRADVLEGRKDTLYRLIDQSRNRSHLDHEPLLEVRARVDYDDYICKGERALGLITNNPPSTHIWIEYEMNRTWNLRAFDSRIPEHLEAPLNTLRIPHQERDVHILFAEQNKPSTDQHGRPNTVRKPLPETQTSRD